MSGRRPTCSRICAARFAADDRLKLANHQRIGMRAERRAEQVIGVADIGHPVAHGLVDGVLQRLAAGVDLPNRRAEQLHANHVQRLAAHVLGAHVDVALETEQRARGGRRHAVLPRAGLRDDARLSHPLGEQRLAERVVDLVRARVRQVFALQRRMRTPALRVPACRTTRFRGKPARLVERRRPTRRSAAAGRQARRGTTGRRARQGSPRVSSSIGATSVSGTNRPP